MNSSIGKISKPTVIQRKALLLPSSRLSNGSITMSNLRQGTVFRGQLKRRLKAGVPPSNNSQMIHITLTEPKHIQRNVATPGVACIKGNSSVSPDFSQVQFIDEDDPALKEYLMNEMDYDEESDSNEDEPNVVKSEANRDEDTDNFTHYNHDYHESVDDHDVKLCCSGCRNLNLMCLTKMNEILRYIKAAKQSGEGSSIINPQLESEPDFSLLPEFPLDTVKRLTDFDAQLTQHAVRKQFEQKIAARGGIKLQKSVSSVMGFFMTNEVSKSFSWTGVGQTIQVSNTNFVQIIVDILQRRHPGTIIKEVQDKIAEWLRRCGDRIRAAEKARERKQINHHDKTTNVDTL